jgi:hypothetical protein
MDIMSLSNRLLKLEAAVLPQAETLVLTCYLRQSGVDWEVAGCETEAQVLARIPPHGPQDTVVFVHAFGCALAGTPHSHANDPIVRWPHVR